MAYDYVVAETTTGNIVTFNVPWEHAKDELNVLCVLVDKDAYSWKVVDAGKLTAIPDKENYYKLECPFESTENKKAWRTFIWRKTATTEDVSYDGTRIPIESIVAKLVELTRKTDENAKECGRALRTPEGDSDSFYPTKDIRAGEIAGFDDEGKPAVGNNIRGIKVVTDAASRAETAAESAETFAERAENAALGVEGVEENVAKYTESAESAAARSQTYATTASNSAIEANKSAESAAEAAESAETTSSQISESVQRLLEAIERAQEQGLIIDVPVATSTVAGKVKLGADGEIPDEEIGGVVGFNANGQMVIPRATLDSYGGIILGDWYKNGELSLATASASGVVKLGTDVVLSTSTGDENTLAGIVGMNENGQLLSLCASPSRFGTIKLGSAFQPTNNMPYVVGIGASKNSGVVGQLAFNLNKTQSDGSAGALVYEIISENPRTYAMRIAEASATQMGAVYIEGGGTTAVSKTYVNSKLEEVDALAKTIAEEIEKLSNISGMAMMSFIDDDGNVITKMEAGSEAQTYTAKVRFWFKPTDFVGQGVVSIIDNSEEIKWIRISSENPLVELEEENTIKFDVDTDTTRIRSAKISVVYGSNTTTLTVAQYPAKTFGDTIATEETTGGYIVESDNIVKDD